MFRAQLRNKLVTVYVGGDQQLYTWELGKGQITLANSGDAYQFALAYVLPADLPSILPLLKPNYEPSGPIKIQSSPSYGSEVGLAAGMQEGTQDA